MRTYYGSRFVHLLFLLVISALSIRAASAEQAGSILVGLTDANGRPARSHLVWIESSDITRPALARSTDETGKVWFRDLPVQNGYVIRIAIPGFEEVDETVSVEPDKVRQFLIKLQPEKKAKAAQPYVLN